MNARIRIAAIVAVVALISATGTALAGSASKGTSKSKTTTSTTGSTTEATSTTPSATSGTTTATGTGTPSATAAPDKDAMMAEMMKEAAPGPMHAMLKRHEGTWNATVTSFMPGAAAPITTTGTETRNMVLGGRFLETKFTGTYAGQPYEGWGLTGYDNKSSKVMWVWADNMSTRAMDLTGTMTPDGKTISCTGSIDGMDGKPMDIRAELTFDSDTQQTYTMYAKMNGQDVKMMQIAYTKATGTADAQPK